MSTEETVTYIEHKNEYSNALGRVSDIHDKVKTPIANAIAAAAMEGDMEKVTNLASTVKNMGKFIEAHVALREAFFNYVESGDIHWLPRVELGPIPTPSPSSPSPRTRRNNSVAFQNGSTVSPLPTGNGGGKICRDANGNPVDATSRSEYLPFYMRAALSLPMYGGTIKQIQYAMYDLMNNEGKLKKADIDELPSGLRYIKATDHIARNLTEQGFMKRENLAEQINGSGVAYYLSVEGINYALQYQNIAEGKQTELTPANNTLPSVEDLERPYEATLIPDEKSQGTLPLQGSEPAQGELLGGNFVKSDTLNTTPKEKVETVGGGFGEPPIDEDTETLENTLVTQ